MISSLLSHGELFIHSREARNEHLLSVPLGSFSDALCFIYLIYQLEYVLYCIVLYCICAATKGLPESGVEVKFNVC